MSICPNCGGEGEVISEYCRKCAGEGRLRIKKDIKVKIPPGVSKGSTLRVRGEGDAGPKGYSDKMFLSFIFHFMYWMCYRSNRFTFCL